MINFFKERKNMAEFIITCYLIFLKLIYGESSSYPIWCIYITVTSYNSPYNLKMHIWMHYFHIFVSLTYWNIFILLKFSLKMQFRIIILSLGMHFCNNSYFNIQWIFWRCIFINMFCKIKLETTKCWGWLKIFIL